MQDRLYCVTHQYNAPAFYVKAASESKALLAFAAKYNVSRMADLNFIRATNAQACEVPIGHFVAEYQPDPSTREGDGNCDREERWVS
jgi:hypothetical protein